jgi:hypothetical protein
MIWPLFSVKPVLEFWCLRRVSGLFEAISSAGPHKKAMIRKRKVKKNKALFIEPGLNNANLMICK